MKPSSGILGAFLATATASVIVPQAGDDVYGGLGSYPGESSYGIIEQRWKKYNHTYDSNLHWAVPLAVSKVLCHKNETIKLADYRTAVTNLKAYCDAYPVSAKSIYVSVAGDMTVYVCSEDDQNPCHKNEWDEAERLMDSMCGTNTAGSVKMAKWGKIYGRQESARYICPRLSGQDITLEYGVFGLPVFIDGVANSHWQDVRPEVGQKRPTYHTPPGPDQDPNADPPDE